MLSTLFTGTDPSANRLTLLRKTPLARSGLVVAVPDEQSVIAFQRVLAKEAGHACLGHRVMTLERLARTIIAIDQPAPDIIPNHIRRAIISEIIRSRIGQHSPYASIARFPGFVNLVIAYIEDMRSCGDTPAYTNPDLSGIAAAYASHLSRLGYEDHEGIISRALENDRPERFAAQRKGPFVLDGFYDLTVRQTELVVRLMQSFSRSAATLVHDDARPGLFALPDRFLAKLSVLDAKIINVPRNSANDADALKAAFRSEHAPDISGDGSVSFHWFRNHTAEADWIAGTAASLIRKGTCRASDIIIVTRYPVWFGSPLERALIRHNVPLETGFFRPLISHPVVKFALNAVAASIRPTEDGMIELVQRSRFAADSESYPHPLDICDDKGWSCMIAEVDSPSGFVESVEKMLDSLSVRSRLYSTMDMTGSLDETAVFEQFIQTLGQFGEVYGAFRKMLGAEEFLSLLRTCLDTVIVPDRLHPSGGVLVTDANHARYCERDVVFAAGLDDTSYPAGMERYSLLDQRRQAELAEHHRIEEPLLFFMTLAGAKRLHFSFPGIDDEGRDNALSPFVRELLDTAGGNVAPVRHTGIPGHAWEGGTPTIRGKLERALRCIKHGLHSSPAMLSTIVSRDAATGAAIARGIDSHLSHNIRGDIIITGTNALYAIRAIKPNLGTYSVSELENFTECPIKYFFRRIIGLEIERPAIGEIDPPTHGNIVHGILSSFFSELKRMSSTRFTASDLDRIRPLMDETVDRIFGRMTASLHGIHTVSLLSHKNHIRTLMHGFLSEQARHFEEDMFVPSLFETGFGSDPERQTHPALEVTSDDRTITVNGRIDRIDTLTTNGGSYIRVIDYKTGNSGPRTLPNTQVLQIPLYLDAARTMILPGAKLHDGVIYSLKELAFKYYKSDGKRLTGESWDEIIDSAKKSAVEAVKSIEAGVFPAPEKCSGTCDFRPLCRGGNTAVSTSGQDGNSAFSD